MSQNWFTSAEEEVERMKEAFAQETTELAKKLREYVLAHPESGMALNPISAELATWKEGIHSMARDFKFIYKKKYMADKEAMDKQLKIWKFEREQDHHRYAHAERNFNKRVEDRCVEKKKQDIFMWMLFVIGFWLIVLKLTFHLINKL